MAVDKEAFAKEVKDEYGGAEESTPNEKAGHHGKLLLAAISAKDPVAIEECIRSIAGMEDGE